MNELILQLKKTGATLSKVSYAMLTEQLISAVVLSFSDGQSIAISVNEDTDEIVVASTPPCQDPAMDASTKSPWWGAVGKPIFAAWMLENHNGTRDAIQFAFGATASDEPRVIQLEGAASTVQVGVLVGTN